MKRFNYFKPQTLNEAFELKKNISKARFVAGGTDLLVQVKNKELQPTAIISLRSISELSEIEVNESVRIGASTTISDIIHHPELGNEYPIIRKAAKRLGSVQIRNVATIGGNLCNCSPSADMALPLLVLEAKVRLRTSETTRDIPVAEFFKGPGQTCHASDEILTDILLDPPLKKAKTVFLKKGRVHLDLAVVSLALLLDLDGKVCSRARIAVGSVSSVPLRLFKVEELLEGETITKELIHEAQHVVQHNVSPITDVRASEDYRRHIVGIYLKRGLEQLVSWSMS